MAFPTVSQAATPDTHSYAESSGVTLAPLTLKVVQSERRGENRVFSYKLSLNLKHTSDGTFSSGTSRGNNLHHHSPPQKNSLNLPCDRSSENNSRLESKSRQAKHDLKSFSRRVNAYETAEELRQDGATV